MQLVKVDECFDDFTKAADIDKESADVYHHRGQVLSLVIKPCIVYKENTFKYIYEFYRPAKITFMHQIAIYSLQVYFITFR